MENRATGKTVVENEGHAIDVNAGEAPSKHCRLTLRRVTAIIVLLALWSLIQGLLSSNGIVTCYTTISQQDPVSALTSIRSDNSSWTKQDHNPRAIPIHVLFALSGNDTDFLAEFEVALKSVMLNAPFQSSLGIHIMADREAYDALEAIFARTELRTWRTRRPITITTYNVQPKLKRWKARIQKSMHQYKLPALIDLHTIGCFFRLFANDVVSDDVKHLLYMDTDVVMMTNIEELWKSINPNSWFHIGASMCSGFIVLSVQKLDTIWNSTERLNLTAIATQFNQHPNDQLVFKAINATYPQHVTWLPEEWDISIADGAWRFKDKIVKKRPRIGMMHFNGGGKSKEAYFKTHSFLTVPELERTWGVARYYERLPWPWARFMAESIIDGEGYSLTLYHDTASDKK